MALGKTGHTSSHSPRSDSLRRAPLSYMVERGRG